MQKITIENLTFAYEQKKNIIQNLSWQLLPGKFYLLIGKTGSGKSTLLKLLAGLYPKYGGKIIAGQIKLAGLTQAMMFQNAATQFTMKTLREEIIFALENLNLNQHEYEERLKKAVTFTQTSRLLDQPISTLSGGEKQRAALSVLIAMNVDLFLLDEPFASCDPGARKFLINKLNDLVNLGKTVIITDHLFDDYQSINPVIYQMKERKVSLIPPSKQKELFKRPIITTNFALPQVETAAFNLINTEIRQNRLLLKQKRLAIPTGKITLITGKNGVGKTSIFKALTQMIPYLGNIEYQNQEVKKLPARKYLTKVGQIFQNSEDQFLKVTVRDELALSKKKRNSYFSDQKIHELVVKLELNDLLDQVVYSLSGGQKKKLQILLMLMEKHQVLLLDEPLAGLDQASARVVIDLLNNVQKKTSKTFLIISHQLDLLSKICDYHLIFEDQELRYVH